MTTSSYPTSADTFDAAKSIDFPRSRRKAYQKLADAVASIQTTLGNSPQGAATNVSTRINTIGITSKTDTYTLAATDVRGIVNVNKGTGVTITVPKNATVAIPVGAVIKIQQVGAGQLTIAAESGATVNTSGATAKTRAQYSVVEVIKTATDTWVLTGDLAAS